MPRILIVEDDALVRHNIVQLLIGAGHDVVAAASAQAGIEQCAKAAFDLVVLDVGLPDFDGIECARRLRASKYQGPIIFLTAYEGASFVARAIEQRAYAYMLKPITGAQLRPLVDTALSAARAEQAHHEKMVAALSDSRDISTAVGMLAERHGWTIEDAFQALRMMARSQERKVSDVAAELLDSRAGREMLPKR